MDLADLRRAVAPGRVVRLYLTREQKRALRDREGQIALDGYRHYLGARAALGWPTDRFPMVEEALQTVLAHCGRGHFDRKPIRAQIRRLVAEGVTKRSGGVRQDDHNGPGDGTHIVPWFSHRKAPEEKRRTRSPATWAFSVGERLKPTPPTTWAHPLFGDQSGRAPPGLPPRDTPYQSLDEICGMSGTPPWERAAR